MKQLRQGNMKQGCDTLSPRTELAMVAMHDKLEEKATHREEFLQTMQTEHDNRQKMYLHFLEQQQQLPGSRMRRYRS